MSAPKITIIGDFDPEYPAHRALRESIVHCEDALGTIVNTRWIAPNELADVEESLAGSCAAIIAPRNPTSPRQLWPEILGALSWLRSARCPTLGIEYGYQHMIIDFAREILGHAGANNTAYDDACEHPVVTQLVSDEPPIDKFKPKTIDVQVEPDSLLGRCYDGAASVREAFRGHYVMNPDYLSEFEEAGFSFPARGSVGGRDFVAAIEWNELPFFVGVAYLPQYDSAPGNEHGLIRALVAAGLESV